MIEVASTLGSIFLLLWAMAAHPQHASCPRGWWLPEGARPDGRYECRPGVRGGLDDAPGTADTAVQPPGWLDGRVYCTGGSRAIVGTNGEVVGCQRASS